MKSMFLSLILVLMASLCGYGQIHLLSAPPPSQIILEISSKTHWRADGPLKTINIEEFKKIDPSRASIFAEYGFSQAAIQELKLDNVSILLEICEMLDPTAAYGVFTFYRPEDSRTTEAPGNLASFSRNCLSFIQNKYYITLRNNGTEPFSDFRTIAEIVSKMLPHSLLLPSLLGRLPEKGHVKNSTVYLMGPDALNQILHGNGKDFMGMSDGAEALWANYEEYEEKAHLLLINYPTQQLAKQHLDAGNQELSRLFPGMNVLYKREGPMVTLVICRSNRLANQLLDQVNYVSTVSWDPKTQPLTVARLFLNVFLFIGISLLITLGGGLLGAVIRIAARRFFPGKFFDRPGSELIHLDLQQFFRKDGSH